MRDLQFLYKDQLANVARRLPSGSINIMGARFIGKSTFIKKLSLHLVRQGRRIETVEGLHDQKPTFLEDILRDRPDVEYLLIDDLDKLLLPKRKFDKSAKEISRLKDLVFGLTKITETRSKSGEREIKLLVTTTGRFFDFLNPWPSIQHILSTLPHDLLAMYSRLEGRFAPVQLNPWEPEWTTAWKEEFQELFQNDIKSPHLLRLWGQTLVDLTGGHPALFEPILTKLARHTNDLAEHHDAVSPVFRRLLGDAEPSNSRTEPLIRRKLEEWIDEDGIHPLARIVRRLRYADNLLEQNVFRQLARLAISDGSEAPEDKLIRDLLKFEYGLVYEDNDGNFQIVGNYLRDVVRRASHGLQTVRIEADPSTTQRGVIYVQTPAGEKSIRLNLNKWRLFQILFAKRGELVTIEEIEQQTNLTKRAVQNLMTRLRQRELREINLEIANERDRGYRLVFPGPLP